MSRVLDRGTAHAWNPIESHEAARKVKATVLRAHVYTILKDHEDGLTSSEVIEIYKQRTGEYSRPDSSIRSRLPELKRIGQARRTGEKRTNRNGNNEGVWKADA